MSPKYRPRFTTEAEEIGEAVRAELGLRNIDPLAPVQLARHLDVPIVALTELPDRVSGAVLGIGRAVQLLQTADLAALSALTVFDGQRRLVVYNDKNDQGRRASDLMHELAHGLLLHRPTQAFDGGGCRAWNSAVEQEATYLAGVLLVPGKAARWSAKVGLDDGQVAARYGCSVEMATWRLNASGARRLMAPR